MDFDTIKKNYDQRLWSIVLVRAAVKKGLITAAQFEEITGMKY